MRYGWMIFLLTLFTMYNIYTDFYVLKNIQKYQKYFKMSGVAFAGLSIYLFFKKHPGHSNELLKHTSDILRYIPLDKNSKAFFNPIFDMTNNHFITKETQQSLPLPMQSGVHPKPHIHKRSVSETKKKFVASKQNWHCSGCQQQLDATFEVDHIIELQDGGTNDVSNLTAMCRNCHGQKTMVHRLG
jgi:hypothetical protein